jgi:hypothetical protein
MFIGYNLDLLLYIVGVLVTNYTGLDSGALVAFHMERTTGVIIGIACAELFNYPVVAVLTQRYGVWLPKLDLSLFALTGIVVCIAFWVI